MAGCVGRVLVGGKDCGAGFALGERLAVTADHVVRGRKDKPVVYVPAGGEAVGVERVQLDAARDAAILWLMSEVEFLSASVAVRGAGWRVESPPAGRNDPQLHGTVTTARMTIQNARGQPVEVVQLQVDEQLGDFGGYSGSAVLDAWGRAVVALLVEQKPLRTPVALGERQAASNVLYAVPIGDVVNANDLSVRASTTRIPEAMGREQVTGQVFISYIREDSYQVDRLQEKLEAAGIPVWRDTVDLWPGEDWRVKIRQAITDNALVFIACFSHASRTRGKSYQNEELTLAIEQLRLRSPDDPWLIPVRFDECEIPDRDIGGDRTLASIQRVDLFGDKFDAGAERLIQAVMRILGRYYKTPPDRPLSEKRSASVALDSATLVTLLQQHGARVLDPVDAAEVRGWPYPASTVYRARTLLVPGDLLEEPNAAINRALSAEGMRLVRPASHRGRGSGAGVLRWLPRTAVLVSATQGEALSRPVKVDAWMALQTLRAATADKNPKLDAPVVSRISLEHLLTGPASVRWSIPEIVPERKTTRDFASEHGRRPVIAVLDTGVGAHPWLDVMVDGSGYHTDPDGFVMVDGAVQESVRREGERAAVSGDRPRQVIRNPWDIPTPKDSMIGETGIGHGTAAAGILRQVVPDARVVPIRIVHSDGIAYEGDLICALSQLAARIAGNDLGDSSAMVDVITLSLGYFGEDPASAYSPGLREVIGVLLAMGVVVAAAGSLPTNRRVYPAAFAEGPPAAGGVPLISVGGLNSDNYSAAASRTTWVTAWASDPALVGFTSTTGQQPFLEPRPEGKKKTVTMADDLDRDSSAGSLPHWERSALAAPRLAAQIVKAMIVGARSDPELRLVLQP